MLPEPDLQTPWLRPELIRHLTSLSDHAWLARALDAAGRPERELDEVLDFFDDTGVVDEPEARIGYILNGPSEAAALGQLGHELRGAFDGSPEQWHRVPAAAGDALRMLRDAPER